MKTSDFGNMIKFAGMVGATSDSELYEYTEEFNTYAAGDWTITTIETGTGSATEAIVADGSDGPWGVLKITTAQGADNGDQLQGPEAVKLESGKPCFFETRMKVSDTGTAEWCVGLSITDTTLIVAGDLSASDFVGFVGGPTDASADTVLFRCIKDSSETDSDEYTVADDTFYKFAFFYDGGGTVYYWIDDVLKGTHTTNIPDNEYLAVSVALNCSTDAAALTTSIDKFKVIQKR